MLLERISALREGWGDGTLVDILVVDHFVLFFVVVLRGNEVELRLEYLSGGDGGNAEIRYV